MPPIILAYHLVDSRFDFGITWTTPRQFERQMRWLAENNYCTRSLSDCLIYKGETGTREIVITFDDGYRALMRYVLPILQRWRFTATVFPIVAYIGKQNRWDYNLFGRRQEHLGWNELAELAAAGWEIGSHSMCHTHLPSLSRPELQKDLRDSKKILEDHLQIPIRHLSLPFGRGNQKVLQAACEAGYRSVSVLGQKPHAENLHAEAAGQELAVFYRRGIYLHDTVRSFQRRVTAPGHSRHERLRQRAISFFSTGTILLKTLSKTRKKSLEI